MAVTGTVAVRDSVPAAVPTRAGELLAVIGPDGARRTAYVLALADAFGGVPAPGAPAAAEAWHALCGLAAGGATVVAACGSVAEAGRYAHRTVLLPETAVERRQP